VSFAECQETLATHTLSGEAIMYRTSLAIIVGLALGIGLATQVTTTQAGADVAIDTGWRFTDGYWNYWDSDDRAWYYTDGRNWYTYGDNNWTVYNFDKKFGKKAFVREGYVVPKPGPNIVVPRHKIYVP
jgi:hypothetical protein